MANNARNTRASSSHVLQRSRSAGPFIRSKSNAPKLQRPRRRQPFLVLYVDENCPLHGSYGKCTCASFVNGYNEGTGNDRMASSESLHRSGDFGQHYESSEDLVPASIKPFNNNPTLPSTQRDIVGNNLHFHSSSQNNGWMDDENDQLAALLLYRDSLKRNLTTAAKAGGGFPKMRHGRVGSQWRHIKQTNTYSGSNLMYIDGTVRVDDSFKYPMPRFGYPPLRRPQQKLSSSYNDLSFASSNPATQSLDTLTWSDSQNQRPSASQYSSRFQRQAKDSFAYRPNDSSDRKPRSINGDTNEYQTKQTVLERIRPGLD